MFSLHSYLTNVIFLKPKNVQMVKMKISKSILTISIFLGAIVTSICFASPVKAVADVDILSHTGYLDSLGYYHVVGEVQNVGDQTVNFIKIIATFYDSSHVVIAPDFTYTELHVLLVGRKSPFDLFLFDTTQSAQVDHYSLSVTFSATSPLPIGLEILSNSSYIDGIGWMHIVGEIKNMGSVKATYVKVIATYYNETGGVVDAEFTFSDPSDIDPNQTAPFDIILTSVRVPYVDKYELTAESTQYALVPEFPTWTSILIILTVLTVVISVYKRRLLTPIH